MLQLGAIATGLSLAGAQGAGAVGLESIDLPAIQLPEGASKMLEERARANQERLSEAEAQFEGSELLATLKQRSEENRAKNKRDLQDKYCYRQAELGIGDCGGLRFIPGATKNGVQKRPDWLNNLLGLELQ